MPRNRNRQSLSHAFGPSINADFTSKSFGSIPNGSNDFVAFRICLLTSLPRFLLHFLQAMTTLSKILVPPTAFGKT